MDKHVDFPTAKLLKEKGFDYYLLYNDFANYYDYFDRSVQGRLHVSDFPEDKFPDENKWIPVPYIHQIIMWLYEKYGIWIYADSHEFGKWCYYYRFNRPHELSPRITENGQFSLEDYNSPTEAYEAAIKHCLTNLI